MRHRIVVLQHGSHGTHRDMWCLARCLQALDTPPTIWVPRVNEGFRTDDGVEVCGERLANNVLQMISGLCTSSSSSILVSAGETPCGVRVGEQRATVQLAFVAHSMGGLIVRSALPLLFREIRRREEWLQVEWKMFCSIATPHAGTRQMDAFIRSYAGRLIGRLYSTAYHDMFLQSNTLTERLLSAEHLACLAAFERRLLVSSANDLLVPLMSSSFMLKPTQRGLTRMAVQGEEEEEEAAFCIFNQDEMYTKRKRLADLCASEWPHDRYPVERRIVKTLLQGAGVFDSIVVDLRRFAEKTDDAALRKQAQRSAHKLSHVALICKPPLHTMEHVFGSVSRVVANELAAC